MANLLFLVHRLPYPPNKGDKIRSFHLLERLSSRHQVHLGTFVDDPDDLAHVERVRERCASLHVARLTPWRARWRSLGGLLSGRPLTLGYYRDAGLHAWVAETKRTQSIDAVIVFSSSMAPYAEPGPTLPTLVDFIDMDSLKWAQYADTRRWPLSWLFRREGRLLLDYERRIAAHSLRSFFVTERETALFRERAPESAARAEPMGNGVDASYFAPDPRLASPYAGDELPLVFTGSMDYWPNADAVSWFAAEVLPRVRAQWPRARLHIVGRNPSSAVRALAADDVVVSGTVPDVRPYLQHAAVVVAPLRLARGIQNKVLEAMAMARPVVATRECAQAIDAREGDELCVADDAEGFVAAIDRLLREPAHALAVGAAARRRVVGDYKWASHLSVLDRHLDTKQSALAIPS